MPSEGQADRGEDKYCLISLVCGILKKARLINTVKKWLSGAGELGVCFLRI